MTENRFNSTLTVVSFLAVFRQNEGLNGCLNLNDYPGGTKPTSLETLEHILVLSLTPWGAQMGIKGARWTKN